MQVDSSFHPDVRTVYRNSARKGEISGTPGVTIGQDGRREQTAERVGDISAMLFL
jgi:hypothetical protein